VLLHAQEEAIFWPATHRSSRATSTTKQKMVESNLLLGFVLHREELPQNQGPSRLDLIQGGHARLVRAGGEKFRTTAKDFKFSRRTRPGWIPPRAIARAACRQGRAPSGFPGHCRRKSWNKIGRAERKLRHGARPRADARGDRRNVTGDRTPERRSTRSRRAGARRRSRSRSRFAGTKRSPQFGQSSPTSGKKVRRTEAPAAEIFLPRKALREALEKNLSYGLGGGPACSKLRYASAGEHPRTLEKKKRSRAALFTWDRGLSSATPPDREPVAEELRRGLPRGSREATGM